MEDTKEREGGYYWCKSSDGDWEILLWSPGYKKWFVPAHIESLEDSDLEEIDEKQIVRSYVPDSIEKELSVLNEICRLFESVDERSQRRIIDYIKSRFNNVWPYLE